MKKTMIVLGLILATVLVVSGCAKTVDDDTMPATSGTEETMDKDDDMADDNHMDDEMKDDDMDSDHMDDEMKDDEMDSDHTDDEMKDDEMGDEAMMKNDGDMAPDFSLMGTDGNTYSLESLQGQKVYVKVWASWCSICLAGLDEIDELAGADEDFTVLSVVAPGYKGEQETDEFKEWFAGLDTENLVVLFDEDASFVEALGVRGFPTSAYIGSDGVLVSVAPGHNDNETIRAKFNEIH